jgi:pyruvate kinase
MTTFDKSQAKQLLAEVVALRKDVANEGTATFRRWRPNIKRRAFAVSAFNFAYYLALRERDLRPLQRRLMALGLSSLGRVEGRVLASLDAVIVALAAIAGVSPPAGVRTPSERQFFRGEARLRANADEIFGPQRHKRSGRILVTLAADGGDDLAVMQSTDQLRPRQRRLLASDDRQHSRGFAPCRPPDSDFDGYCRGPKPRTGAILTPAGRARLIVGGELLLCHGAQLCDGGPLFRTTCTLPEVIEQLKVGDTVALDDGKLLGRIAREERGGFIVAIEAGRLKGLKLKPGRGLTFPNVDLKLDPLADKDRQDLDFVLSNADMVGYSFVESAAHIEELQRELAARRQDWRKIPLVAKIETAHTLRNLPEIIVAAAGRQPLAVMIARGDLAVGIGFAGGNAVALRSCAYSRNLGDAGTGRPGHQRRPLAGGNDRRGDGRPRRGRHAQQGAAARRRRRRAR